MATFFNVKKWWKKKKKISINLFSFSGKKKTKFAKIHPKKVNTV